MGYSDGSVAWFEFDRYMDEKEGNMEGPEKGCENCVVKVAKKFEPGSKDNPFKWAQKIPVCPKCTEQKFSMYYYQKEDLLSLECNACNFEFFMEPADN